MKQIMLIRHGQSMGNFGVVSSPYVDVPLSPLGHAQAQCLSEWLPTPTQIVASEHMRSQQTAQYVALLHNSPVRTEPLLNEFSALSHERIMGMGHAERRPLMEAYWQAADLDACDGVGAESFRAFAARVADYAEQYLPQCLDNTLVFGHGTWMAMLMWHVMGYRIATPADMRAFRDFAWGVPMPNAVAYTLTSSSTPGASTAPHWAIRIQDEWLQRVQAISTPA